MKKTTIFEGRLTQATEDTRHDGKEDRLYLDDERLELRIADAVADWVPTGDGETWSAGIVRLTIESDDR